MSSVQAQRLSSESSHDTVTIITNDTNPTVVVTHQPLEDQPAETGAPNASPNPGNTGNTQEDKTNNSRAPITIAKALETVAENIGDKPVTISDARAIQSAEARATGIPTGVKGGPAAKAMSAVDQLRNNPSSDKTNVPLADVLADVSAHLPADKIVTPRDANRVHAAEARNNAGQVEKGGVASTMQSAATYNQNAGFINNNRNINRK